MRKVVLMGLFVCGLFALDYPEAFAQGGKNSITSQAWYGQPNNGLIVLTYYGDWTLDSKTYKGFQAETDFVDLKNGVWVAQPGTTKVHALIVNAKAKLQDSGTYGLAVGGQAAPGAVIQQDQLAYVKGNVRNIRAKLMAKSVANPNAPAVEIATSIQTITMP